MTPRLYRSRSNAMLGGVAAGLADYFGLDPTLVRLVCFLSIFTAAGPFLYIVAWIIIPPAPEGEASPAFERTEQIRQQVIDTAKDFEAQWKGEPTPRSAEDPEQTAGRRRQLLGWILVAIGVVVLARRFFSWIALDVVWPVIIILAGVFIIVQGMRK